LQTFDMNPTHSSRTLIVTGAAGGMGAATCLTLEAQGAEVIAIDANAAALQQLAADGARIHPLPIDLAAPELIERIETLLAGLPPLAGIVHMAGISFGSPIEQLDDEAWERSFAVNVTPAMRLIRALAPQLRQRGGGSIVNVGSPVGLIGARKPSYAASKGALHGLTMSCARNLGPDGIRVNLLLPGTTITGMTQDWDEARRAEVAQGNFLKRLCTPQEIAHVVAFLLSDASSYVTGSVIDMTAGGLWGH
jgi:NAD(P)-dependent dehydrogenase (short-subunit alcohol dehydrogenase family)